MMRVKNWSFLSIPALLLSAQPISAQDQRVGIGFEYGVHYDAPNDHRWWGFSQSFSVFFPLGSRVRGGYYHEQGVREGREGDGDEFVVDSTIHALRLRYAAWRGAHQEVAVIAGFGGAFYDEALDERSLIGDIGGEVIVYRSSGVPSGHIGVRALYRYSTFDRQDIDPGLGEFFVDDFGGFQIGMVVGFTM